MSHQITKDMLGTILIKEVLCCERHTIPGQEKVPLKSLSFVASEYGVYYRIWSSKLFYNGLETESQAEAITIYNDIDC